MVNLQLLGTTEIRRDEQEAVSILTGPKRLGLLAYLVLARPQGFCRRDKILALFWPERGQKAARNSLSNLLYHLRQALGSDLIMNRGDEEIRINRDLLWCDALVFERAVGEKRLQYAFELYGGPLLAGFYVPGAAPGFGQWLDAERHHLKRDYQFVLGELAETADADGSYETAAGWWEKRAGEDPFDTDVARRLVEALVAAGSRAEATRRARSHAKRLHDEFGTDPEETVRRLTKNLGQDAPEKSSIQERAGQEHAGQEGRLVVSSSQRQNGDTARTLAILPFDALGPSSASSFTEGIHRDLLMRLSALSGLRVIARTSVRKYRNTEKPISEIGRELGASWVLEGEVQEAAERVEVAVRLVNAPADQLAWARTYQRTLRPDSLFQIQREIAESVVHSIEVEFTPDEKQRVRARPTEDLDAYRLYAQGRADLDQRTEEGLARAFDCFEQTLEADPEFALAWAGLSEALSLCRYYRHRPPDGKVTSLEAARRAMELDPELGEAHAALGISHATEGEGPAALRALTRAVELAPSYAEAHIWLGWGELCLGRAERGLGPGREAVALSPLAPAVRAFFAQICLACGQVDKALGEARRARDIQPDYGLSHFMEGLVLHHQGRSVAAVSTLHRALAQVAPGGLPRHSEIQAALGAACAAAGDDEQARTWEVKIDETRDPFSAGLLRAALGDKDGAFGAFERVGQWASFETEQLRYFYPEALGPLRADVRYEKLIQRVDQNWGLAPDGSVPEDPGPVPPLLKAPPAHKKR